MNKRLAVVALLAVFSTAAFAQDGAALYKSKCAVCHGAAGEGKGKVGPKVAGTTKTPEQIVALLTKGGAEKGHHVKPVAGLQPDQAKAIATYVKTLK